MAQVKRITVRSIDRVRLYQSQNDTYLLDFFHPSEVINVNSLSINIGKTHQMIDSAAAMQKIT